MSCPSCGAPLPPGRERCPGCGRLVSPAVQGALAPKPSTATPPARGRGEPLREIPALKSKERAWKDEVRERVRHRKRQRSPQGAELPLFDRGDGSEAEGPAEGEEDGPGDALLAPEEPPARLEPDEDDLPLRPLEREPEGSFELPSRDADEVDEEVARAVAKRASFGDSDLGEPEEDDLFSGEAPSEGPRPVERPAHVGERLQAAAVDGAVLALLFAVVLYFTGRAARVEVSGLLPSWPYLAGYLTFLGVVYAGYFSGATGQTVGKIVVGLRVVDTAGQPPGFVRALLRAVLGALGIALAFAGFVPVFFDPARRAFHDRVLKTRVVKS
jgi:uncharacterized RDD family membrane protein YckC